MVKKFLNEIKTILKQNGKEEYESEIIFMNVLNFSRAELFCLEKIDNSKKRKITKIVKKRIKKSIPLNLIFKEEVFFGRVFKTDKKVLKPRDDTEILVLESLKVLKENNKVLDLCCGSGIIGLTLALSKKCNLVLSDVSKSAIRLSKQNAKKLNANVQIIRSNLFKKINGKFDVIVSNPPYIRHKDIKNLQPEVKKFDPHLALDGGEDGLKFYKQIAKEAPGFLNKNGYLLLEIGIGQSEDVKTLLSEKFETTVVNDLNDIQRVIVGRLKNVK